MDFKLVTIAVEGDADVSVVTRVVEGVGLRVGPIYVQRGKGNLDKKLAAYNQAAQHSRWLVVRDLDRDAPCASALIAEKLPTRAPNMQMRIAVRAAEAWLIADQDGLSRFLKVGPPIIPLDPEKLDDPKATLVHIARHSRDREIRDEMVPEEGTATRVGPNYTGRIIEFATRYWDPTRAAVRSESLRRCMEALQRWKPNGTSDTAKAGSTTTKSRSKGTGGKARK